MNQKVSKTQIQNMIKSYENADVYGQELINRLKRQNGAIGDAVRAMFNDGMTERDFAQVFGVDMQKKAAAPEKPSHLADVGAGFARVFNGVGQAGRWALDKATGGDSYERYTAEKAFERDTYETARKDSGKGMNVGAVLGETLALAPVGLAGRGYQAVRGAAGALRKATAAGRITAHNAAVGAGAAAVPYAASSDERLGNMAFGAVGGIAAPAVGRAVQGAARGLNAAAQRVPTPRRRQNQQAQTRQNRSVASDIVKRGEEAGRIQLTTAERNKAIQIAQRELAQGKTPDSVGVVRKAVLDNHGIQGTKAQVSGSRDDYHLEREFSKRSAPLNDVYVAQQTELNARVQSLADSTGQSGKDVLAMTSDAFERLKVQDEAARKNIGELYEVARSHGGNNISLDFQSGLPALRKTLKDSGNINHYKTVHDIITGQLEDGKLTLLGAENAKKSLNQHFTNGKDKAKDWAFNQAKAALDDWIDKAATDGAATEAWAAAKDAFKIHARNTEIPFFKAVLSGQEPDNAFKKYIVNGTVNDVANLRTYLTEVGDTQTLADLQGATIEYLLNQANKLQGNSSETVFNAAQFKKALNALSDHKLHAILDESQVTELKELSKVADILFNAPQGNAVNGSNTAFVSDVLNGALAQIARRMPFGMGDKVLDIAQGIFDNRLTKSYINGKVPTLGDYEQALLRQGGISEDVIAWLSNPVKASAVASRQMGADTTESSGHTPHDEAYDVWGDDGWQDEAFLMNEAQPSAMPDVPPLPQGVSTSYQMPAFDVPQVADYLPSDFGSYGLGVGNPQNNPQVTLMGDTGGGVGGFGDDMGQPPPTSQESPTMAIQSGLASLIPPPQNPANMGNYESYVQNAVGRIMQTPQMGFILDQMASNNPDFARIEKAQKSLSHTPEWQSFVENLPKDVRQKVHGANILALLTNSQLHGNDGIFNPTF